MEKNNYICALVVVLLLIGSNFATYFILKNRNYKEISELESFFSVYTQFHYNGTVETYENITMYSNASYITYLKRTYFTENSNGYVYGWRILLFLYVEKVPLVLKVSWFLGAVSKDGLLHPFLLGSGSLSYSIEKPTFKVYNINNREFNTLGDVEDFLYIYANVTIIIQ